MDPTGAIIPVRSRQQAMDWSLVLISQGIECRIEPETADHGWQLVLPPDDLTRAIQTLRLYRQENKKHIWSQTEPWTGLVFDWRAVLWSLLLAFVFLLVEGKYSYAKAAGLMVSEKASHGEWWRLFTAVMLHADLPHLLSNVTIGSIFLGFAMGSFGPGIALFASFLAGAGGNLADYWIYPDSHRGLGESGMVMGSLGMLTVYSLWRGRGSMTARQAGIRSFVAGCFLLILVGTGQQSDVLAHGAGFVWGAIFGSLLCFFPEKVLQTPLWNRMAEGICLSLVCLTWWLALGHR
ncbi:MAG: Rhomboid family protein [Verrucomicrobiales bacterium]|nr:Rhomboid family protein [Verrucomicrobiales bacterium]